MSTTAVGKKRVSRRLRIEEHILPVGVVLFALLWVAGSLVDVLFFERQAGAFAGAFFPTEPEEIFDRGLFAATLLSFLAYIRWSAHGTRRSEETASRREEAERKLRVAEARYEALMEQIPAVIYQQEVADAENSKSVTYISRRVEDMLGYTAEEETNDPTHWIRKLHPDDRERVVAEDERTDRTGDPFSVEYREIAKDGSVVWIRDEATLVRDPEGRPLYWQGVQFDITESKLAEAALERQARDLERSNEELEQFAYIASHDLQEPLRMVSSYTQLLARRYGDKLDDDAREFMGYAVDGAARMHTLINDLLRFSRVETRGRHLVPTDLERVLEAALANLRVAIEESGAEVTWDPLPTVPGDEMQLVQLFQNLVGNAIKFRGEEPPRVHVGVERRMGGWEVSVRDNGIGIEEQYRERIFVIFRRLHGRAEYQGTGIGLAICKKIVERHGGGIRVESQPGVGSTFVFDLSDAEGGDA